MLDRQRLLAAYEKARRDLLDERTADGHWVGELSTSALSTATAVSALALVSRHGSASYVELIAGGVRWLVAHQNSDGGWGDTDKSHSNIATTMLVRAALHLAGVAGEHAELVRRAERYIEAAGSIAGLRRRYGKDKTFAVPILTNCALAGLVPWNDVSPLPFELACIPQEFYRFARMPVVSYAIPALVAIGQARFFNQPPGNPLLRWLRRAAVTKSLRVLEQMQPDSGGYLEAVPLTSFVVMSLAATGRTDHAVTQRGVKFLVDSVRPDGSWPIDTNLATWNTTLAINALAGAGEDVAALFATHGTALDWLLACQHRERHPFTGADPGGWGWSDLSGAVPDADDTPGALLALAAWRGAPACSEADRRRIDEAAAAGISWLLGLQNRDGGWPTFCRGWGKLPFDRSGADLTAHAIRAISVWTKNRIDIRGSGPAIERGFAFLARQQRREGSWVPLWFGNQDQPNEENPVYGTAKVLMAYRDCGRMQQEPAQRGLAWLQAAQREDGGWGSVEETALAVETLLSEDLPARVVAVTQGLDWLIRCVETNQHLHPAPIGFYFAKLWYYEKLYPLTLTVAALGLARQLSYPDLARRGPTLELSKRDPIVVGKRGDSDGGRAP